MAQPRRTAHEMFPLVEAYLAGGQTQKQFCAEHDLSVPVLNYWLKKYRHQQADAPADALAEAFVEVRPEPAAGSAAAFVEIAYPQGVRLRFFVPVPLSYLTNLLPRLPR